MSLFPGKSLQHIIWDWNGTLLHDAWLTVEVMNRVLQERNYPPMTLQGYLDEFDFPVKDFYGRIGVDTSEPFFSELVTEYAGEFYRRQFECQLHGQVPEILASFQQQGIQQYILSASEQKGLDAIIDHYQLRPYFTQLIGLDHHYATSKVENGHRLLEEHRIDPKTVVMIGDTTHDLEVAQALGIDCVLVAAGHQSYPNLKAHYPLVIHSLLELTENL